MENQEIQFQNCACCASAFQEEDAFCGSCGYPLKGEEWEQKDHIAKRTSGEIDIEALNKKIKSATNSLYWIGGLLAFWMLVSLSILQDSEDLFAVLIAHVIVVGSFFALAVLGKTKPLTALISGLSLYVILQLLSAFEDPTNLFKGIIVKIIIIGYLIKGIFAVVEVEKIKKDLNID